MTDVHAVLLVPAKGDPHGLLAKGACGSLPPTAHRLRAPFRRKPNTWFECTSYGKQFWDDDVISLVLAWDGLPIPEGLDRAMRRLEAVTEGPDDRGLEEYNLWWCRLMDAQNVVEACGEHGLGTVILLDADGREIGHHDRMPTTQEAS